MKNIIEGYNEPIFNFFEYAWVEIIRATVFLNGLIDQEHLDESKRYCATYSHWTYLVELVYLPLVIL